MNRGHLKSYWTRNITLYTVLGIFLYGCIIIGNNYFNGNNSCIGREIFAPSEYPNPKIGAFSLQYGRLFQTIGWCYVLHTQNQRCELPGINFPPDLQPNKNENFQWGNVFKPIGNCPATKTVRTLLEAKNRVIDDKFIAGMARYVSYNIEFKPNFRFELNRRKEEWKETLHLSNSSYTAFHMRRTDKVGTEAAFSSAVQYLSHLLAKSQVLPTKIFVMTDDPRAVDEVRMFVPSGKVEVSSVANVTRAFRGNHVFMGSAVDTFAELEITAEAEYLVVQPRSNVAKCLKLFRYIQLNAEHNPVVDIDQFYEIKSYWNRLLFPEYRPTKVCPLVSDLELSAPAMACDMPWWSTVVSIQDRVVWGGESNRITTATVSAIAGSILNLVDSLSLLTHGLIPFKFEGDFPFLDGMCSTRCPTTVRLSSQELSKGWRNLSMMNDLWAKMNARFAVPKTRMNLLRLTCEKLSLSRFNIDYEVPNAVCTWANVKRVLFHNHLVVNSTVRQEVDGLKNAIKSKHSITTATAFAVLQVNSRTLSYLGDDEAAAVKYWTAFLESRNTVPGCVKKILLVGDTASVVNRILSGIKSIDSAMLSAFAMDFISVVVVGESFRDLKNGEDRNHSHSHANAHDHSHRDHNTTTASVFAELWALLELMSQADIVILDELSEVGQLVNLMRFQFPNGKTPVLLIHGYLVGTESL